MPLLRPSYLIDEVSRNPLIWNSLECRDLIDEAKNFHLIPERRPNFNTIFKTTIRVCTEMPGVIYALGGINQLQPSPSAVEIYDPTLKRWAPGKPMISQRTRFTVVFFKNPKIWLQNWSGRIGWQNLRGRWLQWR